MAPVSFTGPYIHILAGHLGYSQPAIAAGATPAEAEANAALIVAAPELLEACEEVLNAIEAFPHSRTKTPLGRPQGGIAKCLRAAIAKATNTMNS